MDAVQSPESREAINKSRAVNGRSEPVTREQTEARAKIRDVRQSAVEDRSGRRSGVVPLLITLMTIALALGLSSRLWVVYLETPWTRDATVRAYVVTLASQVSGQIVELPVSDNQFVHRGDLIMRIDPTNYEIAVDLAEAAAQQAKINAQNAEREAARRQLLTSLSVTEEEKQTFQSTAEASEAQLHEAVANLNLAQINLRRTEIRAPVNGWVTNLSAQPGDYAVVGQNEISLVDAESFWVDAYFEETHLGAIRKGSPVSIKLMGYKQIIRGHVDGVARGINVANAIPNVQGLATVNPIFTWVRLAQRIPVRIRIDRVPKDLRLIAGMTATVEVDPR
jgi:RND family efflux transporter MFP subunit